MSNLLQFNADQFSSLSTQEFTQQWENIKLETLWEDEQEWLMQFLNLAKGDNEVELDLNNVLLVKTNNDRMLERCYGPSIFRVSEDGDGLVLKVGSNTFPISIQNERLVVGHLKGRFQWQTKKRLDESTYELLTARLGDNREDDPALYEIGCSLVEKEPASEVNGKLTANQLFLSQNKLDRLLESNSAIGQFFTFPKSGGGSVFKMQQLAPNSEYEVVAVDTTEPHPEYGVSYILRFIDGSSCFARGNSEVVLKRNLATIQKQLASGKTWTLKIGEIKEFKEGKFTVNNALVQRTAALSGSAPKPKPIQQVTASGTALNNIQRANDNRQLAPAQVAPVGFTATSGTNHEARQWAMKQGLAESVAQDLMKQVDALNEERKASGESMSLNDRRLAFITYVNEALEANPITTIEAESIPF